MKSLAPRHLLRWLVIAVLAAGLAGCGEASEESPSPDATPAATVPASDSASVAFASFRLRNWTADDGFPGRAFDIDQTPDGYLWIATDEGVFRFDGARFVAFTTANVPVFKSDDFISLDVLPSGDLWGGTRDLWTYRLRDGVWTAYSIQKAFEATAWVQGFVQDRSGAVWASSTGRSVARFDGSHWSAVDQRIREVWTPFVTDAQGTIWTYLDGTDAPGLPSSPLHSRSGREGVVVQWDGEAFTPPQDARLFGFEQTQYGPLFHRLADGDDIPVSLAEARGRRVLLSDAEGTPRGSFLMGDVPNSARLVDRAGRVWTDPIAADGSLTVFVGDAEVARILPAGSKWIEHVFEDHQGNVWVLSSGGSLLEVTPEPFRRFGSDDGAPLDAESAIVTADGSVLVSGAPGAERSPLFSVRGTAKESRLASPSTPSFALDIQPPTIGLMMQDGRGRTFGTWYRGLFQLDGVQSRMVWQSEVGRNPRIPFPDAADPDALWLGDSDGVLRRFDTDALVMTDSFQVPLPATGFAWPKDVHRTPDGRLWVASRGGLVVLAEDGRPDPIPALAGVPVRDLADGPDGALWAATETRGLVRIRGADVDFIGLDNGLATLHLVAVLFDDSGFVWLSGRSLLYRLRVADAERAFDAAVPEPIDIVTLLPSAGHLGSAEGLVRTAKAPDGSFWIPSVQGVTRIDPQAYARQFAEPPPVLIEAVHTKSGERALEKGASVRLPRGDRSPKVDYTAIDLTAPDLVRFRTQLVGLDDDWKDQESARSVAYSRLGPGTYTFRVQARNGGGVWTDPVEATLVVPAYFYETWWFAALCVLGLLGVLVLGVRARERTLTARQRHLEAVVKERTGQLQAEKDTVAAQAKSLETLDTAKSTFFANVSHEFRTPLTLTMGPLDDILDGEYGPVPDAMASPVGMARRSAERVLTLINQMLDIARLEAGTTPLRARRLDLADFVKSQVDSFAALALRSGIGVRVCTPAERVEVWADPEHTGTILTNLLSNAFKFTPDGGTVRVTVETEKGQARVIVRDSGPGISQTDLPRVFDRFYQAANESARPLGSGIGLALAHELAALHGGSLAAESTVAESDGGPSGSAFTLALPLGRTHLAPDQVDDRPWERAAPPRQRADTGREVDDDPDLAPKPEADDVTTVLVADDHADIRVYVRRHLEGAGYRVLEAADGDEAVRIAKERLPDLVVSDVMMPKLDGLGLCRALRADPETDFLPILLLTAKAAPEDRLDGLAEHCDDYLTKPFDARELVARIDNLIAIRRRLRERFSGLLSSIGDGVSGDPPSAPLLPLADELLVAAVDAAIAQHLGDEAFDVNALADAVGQSRSHLLRKTTTLMGAPPSDLIRTARLDRAAQILDSRAGTVSEIAYAVGFKSVAHFSNAFTTRFGVRPSAYVAADADADEHAAREAL